MSSIFNYLCPFAGTSATGVAALQEGREYIGIELSPSYRRMSERRLAQAMSEPRKAAVDEDEEQPSLFSGVLLAGSESEVAA